MMTCHPSIHPAATCTVPRTQIISRQPRGSILLDSRLRRGTYVSTSQRRSTPTATGQRRSTPPATGQRRRITVVIGDQRRRTTVDCRWTTVDHHRSTVVGKQSTLDMGRVRIGSGPGPPRVSHVCTRVSHVCPRGIHVDADVDNMPYLGIDP
nr:hypothetical protein [Tanacetum cinerariifolium]